VALPVRCRVNEGLRASCAVSAQRDLVGAQACDGFEQLAHLALVSLSSREATSSNGCVTRSR
jgi:hypothetical protein